MIRLYEGADVYKIVLTSGKELELTESELDDLQSEANTTILSLENQVDELESQVEELQSKLRLVEEEKKQVCENCDDYGDDGLCKDVKGHYCIKNYRMENRWTPKCLN